MRPDELRSLYEDAERLRSVREHMMDQAHSAANLLAQFVSDNWRRGDSTDNIDETMLRLLISRYDQAWLDYLAAAARAREADQTYAAAHEQLSAKTRTQTDAPA